MVTFNLQPSTLNFSDIPTLISPGAADPVKPFGEATVPLKGFSLGSQFCA
jgi:hypothetical protein